MSARKAYKVAIDWIADNDDTEWTKDGSPPIPRVTAALVADLYDKSIETVTADIRRRLKKIERASA